MLSQLSGFLASGQSTAVNLTGVDLYPDCSKVIVTVGRWVWAPVACGYSYVTLMPSAGGGVNLELIVSVGGTNSTMLATVSYVPPAVTAVQAALLSTFGGSLVQVPVLHIMLYKFPEQALRCSRVFSFFWLYFPVFECVCYVT